jgi:hypothetical protein
MALPASSLGLLSVLQPSAQLNAQSAPNQGAFRTAVFIMVFALLL